MVIVINKQQNGNAFKLPDGRLVDIKGNNIMNQVSDEDWEYVYSHWKNFIDDNTFSDKNPKGFFVFNNKKSYVEGASKELQHSEGIEGGARMTVEEGKSLCYSTMTRDELKARARELNISFYDNVKTNKLINLIVEEEIKGNK